MVCLLDSILWNHSPLSVCLSSVHPSLTFLKIGSLVFSDIVHYDSWPWYLVTAEARFLEKKKKNWQSEFGPTGPKLGPNLGFLPFSQVWFISFLWNHLQQFITSSTGKTHKTFLGTKFGLESGPKSGVFLPFSQVWLLSFPVNCIDDSLEHCLTTCRGKTHTLSNY